MANETDGGGGKMYRLWRARRVLLWAAALLLPVSCLLTVHLVQTTAAAAPEPLKWVDFTPTYEAMQAALQMDIATVESETHLDCIESLAWLGCRYGGNFSRYRYSDLAALRKKRESGQSMAELAEGNPYYDYYYRAYSAVLGNMLGGYQWYHEGENGEPVVESGYGLIAFCPIARGWGFSHYDDFGSSRSYGYRREHLGNDLMAGVGTPVVAVESGTVEALGWNRYGGWRIGIRSRDTLRYYYYAHLQKGHPYVKDLKEGDEVTAGQVIGYVGMTGYSDTEETNGMKVPHLHFGMQLIFDESQKEGNGEIWIDVYQIVRLLSGRRSTVVQGADGEYHQRYEFIPTE